MLIYFSIENFKSIKNRQTINLMATSLSEHKETNLIDDKFGSVLKSALLYGHNASGKSKILDALVFYRWFILNSATEMQSTDEIEVEPFLLNSKTDGKPSYFEGAFVMGKKKYRYGFECDQDEVKREWLLETTRVKEYPLFLRIGDEYEIDEKRMPNANGLQKRTRQNALFLSVCSQWNVEKAENIIKWFKSIYTLHGLMTERYRTKTLKYLRNDETKELINEFMRAVDLGIEGIEAIDVDVSTDIEAAFDAGRSDSVSKKSKKPKTRTAVLSLHKKFNEKNIEVENETFLFDRDESAGTIKFFNILGSILDCLLEGRLLIADELDARFHSLLTKTILKSFNSNKISSRAQLIAACQDTSQIDKRVLRRDQILIIDKDKYGSTGITPLAKYKPRKGEAIEKNYLSGKYGGIPLISGIDQLFENGEEEE